MFSTVKLAYFAWHCILVLLPHLDARADEIDATVGNGSWVKRSARDISQDEIAQVVQCINQAGRELERCQNTMTTKYGAIACPIYIISMIWNPVSARDGARSHLVRGNSSNFWLWVLQQGLPVVIKFFSSACTCLLEYGTCATDAVCRTCDHSVADKILDWAKVEHEIVYQAATMSCGGVLNGLPCSGKLGPDSSEGVKVTVIIVVILFSLFAAVLVFVVFKKARSGQTATANKWTTWPKWYQEQQQQQPLGYKQMPQMAPGPGPWPAPMPAMYGGASSPTLPLKSQNRKSSSKSHHRTAPKRAAAGHANYHVSPATKTSSRSRSHSTSRTTATTSPNRWTLPTSASSTDQSDKWIDQRKHKPRLPSSTRATIRPKSTKASPASTVVSSLSRGFSAKANN